VIKRPATEVGLRTNYSLGREQPLINASAPAGRDVEFKESWICRSTILSAMRQVCATLLPFTPPNGSGCCGRVAGIGHSAGF
jgi:hypothetical protein